MAGMVAVAQTKRQADLERTGLCYWTQKGPENSQSSNPSLQQHYIHARVC